MDADQDGGENSSGASRRSVLRYGALVGTIGLAGCSSGGTDDDGTTQGTNTTQGTTPTETSDKTTTTDSTPETTEQAPPSIDVIGAEVTNDGMLEVSLTATSEAGIGEVAITTADGERTIEVDSRTEFDESWVFDAGRGAFHNATVTVIDDSGQQSRATTDETYIPLESRLVLSPYYTWYDEDRWDQGHASDPQLGLYDSNDPAVADQHLSWAAEYGIDAFVVSWWGPDRGSTAALEDGLLSRDWPDGVEYCVLYEPYGPTGGLLEYGDDGCDLDDPTNRKLLTEHFSYIADNYAKDPNYLEIDGRPVVYFWIANTLNGDVQAAFSEAAETAGFDPYLIGDVPFWNAPLLAGTSLAETFDAITDYIAFAPDDYRDGTDIETEAYLDAYSEATRRWQLAAQNAGLDFFPVVQPSYTEYGDTTNTVHPRDHDLFRDVCDRSMERVDPGLEGAVVTSFNEWHEDSHVEPDTEFGTETLEVVQSHVSTATPRPEKAGDTALTFEFERTARPADVTGADDTRELAFACTELSCRDESSQEIASFDIGGEKEPLLVDGVFESESNGGRSWRWLGGPAARAVFGLEEETAASVVSVTLKGRAFVDVETTISIGDRAGAVQLTGGWNTYQVDLAPVEQG